MSEPGRKPSGREAGAYEQVVEAIRQRNAWAMNRRLFEPTPMEIAAMDAAIKDAAAEWAGLHGR